MQVKLKLLVAVKLKVLLLLPFLTFKLVNWLLEQFSWLRAWLLERSNPTNWLLKHCKSLRFVFAERSKLVKELFWQANIWRAVLLDKFRLVNVSFFYSTSERISIAAGLNPLELKSSATKHGFYEIWFIYFGI